MTFGIYCIGLSENLARPHRVIVDLLHHSLIPVVVLCNPENTLKSLLPIITTSTPATEAMSYAFATPVGVSIMITTSMLSLNVCA